MSADTITNFIQPTSDVMTDVKDKLYSSKLYNKVRVYAGDNWGELWKTLSSLPTGSAVVSYTGSTYQRQPRRALKFSIIVVVRQLINDERAQKSVMKLIDDTISLVDHEVYESNVIYKVTNDSWLEYGNATLSAYKIDFIAEDY